MPTLGKAGPSRCGLALGLGRWPHRLAHVLVALLLLTPQPAAAEAVPAISSEPFVYLDLSALFNNDGISYDENPLDGDFDFTWTALPAEELPDSHAIVEIRQARYRFPDKTDGAKNNLVLFAQRLDIPPGRYTALYLLAAATAGMHQEQIQVVYADGTAQAVRIQVRNFGPAGGQGQFGALSMTHRHGPSGDQSPGAKLWSLVVPLDAAKEAVTLQFPDNPLIRVFAITLQKKAE